jgi:hypothetical protein
VSPKPPVCPPPGCRTLSAKNPASEAMTPMAKSQRWSPPIRKIYRLLEPIAIILHVTEGKANEKVYENIRQ